MPLIIITVNLHLIFTFSLNWFLKYVILFGGIGKDLEESGHALVHLPSTRQIFL